MFSNKLRLVVYMNIHKTFDMVVRKISSKDLQQSEILK